MGRPKKETPAKKPKRDRTIEQRKLAPKGWKDPATGRYLPGNKYSAKSWGAKSSYGRNPIYTSEEQLSDACYQYFQWVEENPMEAAELVKHQGEAKVAMVPKMRVMSIWRLCLFIGISEDAWEDYRKKPELSGVVREVEATIKSQQLEGASCEMLSPNIIARLLGLADKHETKVEGTLELSPDQQKVFEDVAKEIARQTQLAIARETDGEK